MQAVNFNMPKKFLKSSLFVAMGLSCVFALSATHSSANAQQVAIVEDISGESSGLMLMDFLANGDIVKLAAHETLVLGYFESCTRETITGGKITIGENGSTVTGGSVSREQTECDGGRMVLSMAESSASGVSVTRGQPANELRPAFSLHGTSPVVKVLSAKRVIFERVDVKGFVMIVPTGGNPILDLAKLNLTLMPGATYRAKAGKASVIFEITSDAKPGALPVVTRFLQING
jgi:hypothetical protein